MIMKIAWVAFLCLLVCVLTGLFAQPALAAKGGGDGLDSTQSKKGVAGSLASTKDAKDETKKAKPWQIAIGVASLVTMIAVVKFL
jgi:hypothetical protein